CVAAHALHLRTVPCTHTAAPAIYTLSLHDALPISVHVRTALRRERRFPQERRHVALRYRRASRPGERSPIAAPTGHGHLRIQAIDRKSTRLNSSHVKISYAVFCLKKKKTRQRALRL